MFHTIPGMSLLQTTKRLGICDQIFVVESSFCFLAYELKFIIKAVMQVVVL